MKTMNDVNALYDKGLTKHSNGLMVCPVCGKSYKSELAGIKHVNERNCHKLQDIVAGTVHETKGYGLYKLLVAAMKPNAQVSLNTFRKSPLFNPVMRFSMFCSLHSVFSPDVYLAWLNEIKGIEQLNAVLSNGIKEEYLREWRVFVHKHNMIPSEYFYNSYRQDLIEDDDFFIRSVEKAQIGLVYLASKEDFPFEERLDKLPADYQMRLNTLMEQIL